MEMNPEQAREHCAFLVNSGRYHEALSFIEKQRESLSSCDALLLECICHLELGLAEDQPELEARAHLKVGVSMADQILSQCPEVDCDMKALLLGRKGCALLRLGQRNTGIWSLRQALALDEAFAGFRNYALEFLAADLVENGQADEAIDLLLRAIRENIADGVNQQAYLYAQLARAYEGVGKPENAEYWIRQARQSLQPDEDGYRLFLKKTLEIEHELLQRTRPDRVLERIDLLRQLLALEAASHERSRRYVEIGVVLEKAGEYSDALAHYIRAAEEDPQTSIENRAHLYAAAVAYHLKQYHFAIRHFEYPFPKDLSPESASAYELIKANTCYAIGRLRMAESIYQKVLASPFSSDEMRRIASAQIAQIARSIE